MNEGGPMGFECALAIVTPQPSDWLVDLYPSGEEKERDDLFFDTRIKVQVPAREWRVLRFLDFGSVRVIDKPASSLTPQERAMGTPEARAAKCVASFMLGNFYECERKLLAGDRDFLLPFVADHLIASRDIHGENEFLFSQRFKDVFEILGTSDVVRGLWTHPDGRDPKLTTRDIFKGAFHTYNYFLLRGQIENAVNLGDKYSLVSAPLWISSREVASWLDELQGSDDLAGEELRKDPLSFALSTIWRDMFKVLSAHGARVIPLTGSLYMDAYHTMRSQGRYL